MRKGIMGWVLVMKDWLMIFLIIYNKYLYISILLESINIYYKYYKYFIFSMYIIKICIIQTKIDIHEY